MFVFQMNTKSECQPLSFTSYIKYNEYKFFSRKTQDEFVTFIANYEQLKVEMEEDIYKTYSRAQLSVLDLLSASNLATEDVEQILNSNHENASPEDLYKAVKISVQEIAEALSNLDDVNEEGANDATEDGANNVTEDDFSINQIFDDAKEEIRETLNTIKEDEKPLVIKFTQSIDSRKPLETTGKTSNDKFYCEDGVDKPLRKLRKLQDSEKYMNCPDCGKTVTKAYYLEGHKQYHLNEGLTEQCPECGKVVSKNAFRKHKEEHRRKQSGDMYFCDLCPYKANAKYKVNSHRKIQHVPKAYTCDLCGVMFKVKDTLNKHMLTKHRDPVNAITYQCEMCEYTSKCEISLNTHIQFRHREGRIVCSFCGWEVKIKIIGLQSQNHQSLGLAQW